MERSALSIEKGQQPVPLRDRLSVNDEAWFGRQVAVGGGEELKKPLLQEGLPAPQVRQALQERQHLDAAAKQGIYMCPCLIGERIVRGEKDERAAWRYVCQQAG